MIARPQAARRFRRTSAARHPARGFALLSAVGAAPNSRAAMDIAAAGLRRLLRADQGLIMLLGSDAGPLLVVDPPHTADPAQLIERYRALAELLEHDPRPLMIADLSVQAPCIPAPAPDPLHRSQALLIVPIRSQQHVIGIMAVAGCAGRAWQPWERALVEAMAMQIGQREERAELLAGMERRTQELTALNETALAISAQLDLPTTLHNIVEQAARLAHADSGGLYLCDDPYGELEVVVSYGLDRDYRGERIKLGEGLAGRAAVSRQVESTVDYVTWDGRATPYADAPFRAVLAVPLLQEDRVLGVLDLLHLTPGSRFTDDDIAIVKMFAAQAVVAITNARLYDQASQDAARMTALARASQLLDAHGDVAASIQPLVFEGMGVLGAQGCLVVLADAARAHETYAIGMSDEQAELFRQNIVPGCLGRIDGVDLRYVWESDSGAPLEPFDQLALALDFRSTLTLPLLREERALGCVTYFFTYHHSGSQDEIELARVVANQMAAMIANAQLYHEVHEANRLKSEFVSTVSHELRTPMGAIIGYTELLTTGLYGPLNDTMREPLQRVKANADHLLTLINQMLDLSRIEAQRLELQDAPFNPHDLVQAVHAMMQPLALTKGLTFHATTCPHVPSIILGDVARLRQILINLVGNSVKFTQHGQIELRCLSDADAAPPQLVFEVSDTGMGIPADQLELIWEPFRQGNSSNTREYGGTGLGLAIVQKLTQLMGGTVSVSSTVGSGSTFTVRLPLLVP